MRRLALFLSFLAFVFAQPAAAASTPALTSLETQLRSLLSSKSADIGIAALDLNSGETVSIKGDTKFPMASTVKLAVAATYLSHVDRGRRSLDDTINGTSVRTLMARMLIHSDNRATDIIMKDLGGPDAVQEWLDYHGFKSMRIDRTIARLLADKRDLWDHRDSATPLAMVEFLRQIDRGTVLKPASRHYLLGLMARCKTGRNRMKALLPFGTLVEHKPGTLNGLTDDVGFITLPDGRRLAVAFFARGGSNRPASIAEAARTVYDGFRAVVTWPFQQIQTGR